MKKLTSGVKAAVIGLALFGPFAWLAVAAERPGFEAYVVRSGDTLSKIAGRVFGDDTRWREILRENPQVTNANRIFPGDILQVPVPETAMPAGGAGGELEARPGADAGAGAMAQDAAGTVPGTEEGGTGDETGMQASVKEPELPMERVLPTPVVSPARYRTAGYLSDELPTIAIVASPENRLLLGSADTAIVNAALPPGTRFTVVRADRRVFHPVTGASLGWLVRILGSAEVTCREERTSSVTMGAMNDAAIVGDYLVPSDPNDVLEKNELTRDERPDCLPAGVWEGVIVAFDEETSLVGEHDLAYIDRGTAAGVAPGQRFTIYREIAPEGRIVVGELQVLRAGVHTSTALITAVAREVKVGYLLRAR